MKDIARYALEKLKKAGADKASCRAWKGQKKEFNIEANEFTLLRTLFSDDLQMKALVGGRKGVCVINKLDRASIDEAVSNCIALAKSAEPDEAEDIAPLVENADFDTSCGGEDISGLFKRSQEYLAQVRDEFPKIIVEGFSSSYDGGETAYVNSNGVCFTNKIGYYSFNSMFVSKDGEKSSSFNYGGAQLSSVNAPFMQAGMHRQLLEEAEKSLDTRMVEKKFTGKIIVTPACDDILWDTILQCFLGDRAMIEGTSRWKDALGTAVADAKLTMRAAPLHPQIVAGARFNFDGFVNKNVDFIADGVLKNFALSLYGANKTGKPRAGNTAASIEVAAGAKPLADIIKGIGRGVLVNRFSGGSPGPSGDVSGVAKNSFLIENGQVTGALSETMISFNIIDVLAGIPAISRERCLNGASILPWCCFEGVTISGK
jgi:PmbA protein